MVIDYAIYKDDYIYQNMPIEQLIYGIIFIILFKKISSLTRLLKNCISMSKVIYYIENISIKSLLQLTSSRDNANWDWSHDTQPA